MIRGKSHMSPTMTSCWVKMRFSRLHCVFVLLLFSTLGITSIQSYPNGVGESADNGCMCHGSASNSTEISLIGMPTFFESNQTFHLTLQINSSVAAQSETVQGGFRLLVSDGIIEFENQSQAQEMDAGWTHTSEGNAYRSWNFTWTAPEDNTSSVEIVVHGNAVNNNENPLGDEWNSFGVTIPGSSFDGSLIQPDVNQSYSLTDYSIIIGGLIAILGFLYVAIK